MNRHIGILAQPGRLSKRVTTFSNHSKLANLAKILPRLVRSHTLPAVPFEPVDARSLEKAIIDEAFWVMGMDSRPWLGRMIGPVFRPPVGRFSRLAADFENAVAGKGLHDSTRDLMNQFIVDIDIIGAENLPAEGPLLIAANHPAAYDFFLIAASLPRDDMKLVASNINAALFSEYA